MTYKHVVTNIDNIKTDVLDKIATGQTYAGYTIITAPWYQSQVLVILGKE